MDITGQPKHVKVSLSRRKQRFDSAREHHLCSKLRTPAPVTLFPAIKFSSVALSPDNPNIVVVHDDTVDDRAKVKFAERNLAVSNSVAHGSATALRSSSAPNSAASATTCRSGVSGAGLGAVLRGGCVSVVPNAAGRLKQCLKARSQPPFRYNLRYYYKLSGRWNLDI